MLHAETLAREFAHHVAGLTIRPHGLHLPWAVEFWFPCRLSWSEGSSNRDVPNRSESGGLEKGKMIDLNYSLVIEATDDPSFFGFYSPDLEGFTGVGNSIEDCLYKARWGMQEHVALLREEGLPIPASASEPKITIQNAKAVLWPA